MREYKKLRIAYLSGPCDAVSVYSEWSENRKQDYFGSNYMKQFFEVCKEINADAYVITTLPGDYSICQKGTYVIENRPVPSNCGGGRFTWQWSIGLRVSLQN